MSHSIKKTIVNYRFFIAITQCVIILEIASSSCEAFISGFFVR